MENNDIVPGFDNEKNENLNIVLHNVPDVEDGLVLELNGFIDTYNSNCFQKRVHLAIEKGFIRLIFICGGLNNVSSTGIGSFATFLKAVKPKGGDLVLVELQPKVYEILELLDFSQFFIIKDNFEDSIHYFRSKAIKEQEVEVFPKTFSCPVCSKKLKALKPGRFRCSECKTILTVDGAGIVSLG